MKMRKLLLLITSLLTLGVSGAWATESTIYLGASSQIKTNGTFGGNNDQGWRGNVSVSPITLSGCISGSSGYIDAGYYGSKTLTISVPSGLTISSYSIALRLTGSTTDCTADGVKLNNSSAQTVSASGINAQSTTITFSDIAEDANRECIIEITDLSVVVDGIAESFTREVNAANGKFYSGNTEKSWTSGNSLYGNKWLSSATNPQLTLYCGNNVGGGSNNIIIDADFRIHNDTYTLSVPGDRYSIKGYVITGYTGAGKVYAITPANQSAKNISTNAEKPTTIYVDGLNAETTSFTVSGTSTGNPWIYITSFRVAVEDKAAAAITTLNALADIPVYATSATAAKTAVASMNTISDIENTINSVVNINVAFGNCNTTNPVKYLATTGANITGSNFSTDAAWKLTNFNAQTGTFKIYNEAHETFMGALPSAYNTAANATTDGSQAGIYTLSATGEGDAGGAGKAVFHQPSFGNSYECIHYQTANSIAVRWGASAKASQWDVLRVYSLTYNHYKVADAANPSTESATLLSSSTNYYISGTSIEYADPFASLTPVTSLNSKPSDGSITSDVVVNYYYENDATLPFTTSTISNGELDNPTWYYMKVNGLVAYPSDNKMKVDPNSTGLNYERWCFVGDAIYGFQIFAESKGVAYPLNIATMANNDNVQLTSTSTNTRWFVSGSDINSLTFYQKSGETTFALCQLGDHNYGSGWQWKVGLWSTGSEIVLIEANDDSNNAVTITACDEALATITANDAFINAGKLGYPSDAVGGPYRTFFSLIPLIDIQKTPAKYKSLIAGWNTYLNTTNITTPPAGFYKFYHKTTSTGNRKYVYADGQTAKSSISNGTESQKIWYFDGTNSHLVNYNGGYQFSNMATLNTTGIDIAITGHTTHSTFPMPYNIKPSNASAWCVSNDDNDYQLNRSSITEGCNFYIESVTSLPITFKGEYASFYSPVDLTIPDNAGLKVYTGTLNGKWLTLNEVTGTLPANTGVILHLDNWSSETTVDFPILSTVNTENNTALTGTVAAQPAVTGGVLVLGKSNGTWGIYNYEGTLGGFKAYMVKPAGVKGFTFTFGDADAIANVLNGEEKVNEVYDLSGRRVNAPARGLYIVNGKKVVIK